MPTYADSYDAESRSGRVIDKDGYLLVFDPHGSRVLGTPLYGVVAEKLLARFPHPRANPKAACWDSDPENRTRVPDGEPYVTAIAGSFSSAGAKEMAFMIDYCPSGLGLPATRRVIVLDGDKLVLDQVLPDDAKGAQADLAIDVDGDGREELLAGTSLVESGRTGVVEVTLLRLAPGNLKQLGTWSAYEKCGTPHKRPGELTTSHTIWLRMKDSVPTSRVVAKTKRCPHLPPPPH